MCIGKRASEQILQTLTTCDLVKTVSYSLFTRPEMNLSKLGLVNKALIFGTGLSTEFDCRSVREWEENSHRYLNRGAVPTYIVVPVLVNKQDKKGNTYQELVGYRDAHLFSVNQTYGDAVVNTPVPVRVAVLKSLSERFNLDLGSLPEQVEIVSYYNETDHGFELASYELKRFIYNVVLRAIKVASFKKQPAKDRIILELLTLAILRSLGFVVDCNKEYHAEISRFSLYQRLSTTASYFSILKGIEIVWETIDLPVLE